MALDMEVMGRGHIVLNVDAAPLPSTKKGQTPKFWAHFYCGQIAGYIKMPLGMEVGLSPGGDIVLDGDPAPSPLNVRCGQTAG